MFPWAAIIGGMRPPPKILLGGCKRPPTIATFSKQKLDFFPSCLLYLYIVYSHTVPQNIYSISFPCRIRGICNTCIRRGSGASG